MNILEDEFVMDAVFIYKNLYDKFDKDFKIKPSGNVYKRITRLCCSAFLLGYEYGKEDIRRNIAMMKEDEDVKRELNTRHSSHKTPEALMMLLELYANKSLTFDDNKIARKKAELVRAYVKYNQLEIKLKQEGRILHLIR